MSLPRRTGLDFVPTSNTGGHHITGDLRFKEVRFRVALGFGIGESL